MPPKTDENPLVLWVTDAITSALKPKASEMKKFVSQESNTEQIQSFFRQMDHRALFVFYAGASLVASVDPPSAVSKKGVFFLKRLEEPITLENIDTSLIISDIPKNPLEGLSLTCQEVFLPLLMNHKNMEGLPEVVVREVLESFQRFISSVYMTVGQARGTTLLPLPPPSAYTQTPGEEPQPATTVVSVRDKDRIHALESSLVTWTRQIKNILRSDPESVLKGGKNCGPLAEIEFWESKAKNLNAVHDQLMGEKIQTILQILETSKSTYVPSFRRLIEEVSVAREESNDNVIHLATLRTEFEKLSLESSRSVDFPKLGPVFKRIIHLLSLVWKHSQHYNTPARLVVIMQEICNAVIDQARAYVNTEEIFTVEAPEAVDRLKLTLKVCGALKTCYFEYKTKIAEECPTNPWRVYDSAMFFRLDSFLERCCDILDLLETVVQFSRLERIEIGGTKGKTLSQSVQQIHIDFIQAFEAFQHVPYDLLNVEVKTFDDDFYEFRCVIKELERRLGSILSQGFDDCTTIFSAFKLVESFEGLLERDLIQADLEKKQTELLRSYESDLKQVQEIFQTRKTSPPVYVNLPPTAGAIMWSRGLLERVEGPMLKFKQVSSSILETDEAKELVKIHDTLAQALRDFEHSQYEEWSNDVGSVSSSKLKQCLLVRDEQTLLLKVNFDPELERLLREVNYLDKINKNRTEEEKLSIPKEALDIFKKAEIYRRQTGKLELIVNMYNGMLTSLLDVERPLLDQKLQAIDEGLKKGLTTLNWKGYGIDEFINASMTNVKTANATLSLLKANVAAIEKILQDNASEPLFERRETRVFEPEEFGRSHAQMMKNREGRFREGAESIHAKLHESYRALEGISKGSPAWKNYVEYINQIVVSGITTLIKNSLVFLEQQLDPENLSKSDVGSLLEIRLELVVQGPDAEDSDDSVHFTPVFRSSHGANSLESVVLGWIEDFFSVSTFMHRLDTGDGDYRSDMDGNEELTSLKAKVLEHFGKNADECMAFRDQFLRYSSLWTQDIHQSFENFLKENRAEGEEPTLEEFDERICKFEDLHIEVQKLPNNEDIGWIRVDAKPMKNALSSTCGKWKAAYTSYLVDRVTGALDEMSEFIDSVNEGLAKEVPPNDMDALLEVMGHIRSVRMRSEEYDNCVDPLHDVVGLLKKHDVDLGDERIRQLESMPIVWAGVKKQCFAKREELSALQDNHAKKVKDDMLIFNRKVEEFRATFLEEAPFAFNRSPDESYEVLDQQHKKLMEIESEAQELQNLQGLFELTVTEYKELQACRSEIVELKRLWDFISLVHNLFEFWMDQPFKEVDVDDLVEKTKSLSSEPFPPLVRTWDAYGGMKEEIKNMLVSLPLVQELRSPAIRERHWKRLPYGRGRGPINPDDPSFCLRTLLELNLHEYEADVIEIVDRARKELIIEKNLKMISEFWGTQKLDYEMDETLKSHRLKSIDEIVESLEEHQVTLQNMQSNKFVEYFDSEVKKWMKTLGVILDRITLWSDVQRSWSNLYPIFVLSEDIRVQLPEDSKRFEKVDGVFRLLMQESVHVTNVVEACYRDTIRQKMKRQEDLYMILTSLQSDLETCEKSLAEYLETKRMAFPRFYFVSSADLVDILSKGSTPHLIMKHMSKLIDSVDTLVFDHNDDGSTSNFATRLISKEGEELELIEKYQCIGPVETWCNGLLEAIRETLRARLGDAYAGFSNPDRKGFLMSFPAQLVVVASRIWWTYEVNKAFDGLEEGNEHAMKEYHEQQVSQLENLTEIVQEDLDANTRRKIITLITVDVHARDVVSRLIAQKIDAPAAFDWQSQLRYTFSDEKGCRIDIADASFLYQYEYIGNGGCLVITPLTDRCYITLAQSLRLIMGGAPAGPAGTGKTETTKDLSRALGNPCYVFNCSEQMDYRTLGNIFKGLAMTGAWGCFDEFNRILIEVLSVVATQLKTILDALAAKRERFHFLGEDIQLRATIGVFITMNPGYKGRTELPENLKALFRPCAMIVPDFENICEIMLASEGFKEAKRLAKKFVTLFMLNKELLSKQDHYDWGLRAIKSVLVIAGGLKRAELDIPEEKILMRALRDTNMAKLARDDIDIFRGLITDLFPEMDLPPKRDADLEESVHVAIQQDGLNLQAGENDIFVVKVIQLKELLDVRHSVFVLGPPGAGKTSVWKALARSMVLVGQKTNPQFKTHFQVLNPKAISSNELYGYVHPLTREWKDGILSVVMRNYADMSKGNKNPKWIVLDGDIDPEWIESMNTVMDDNKVLTLASNERIPLTPSMRMIFEVSHLKNATPATVSRAGILFINETDIGWKPYVESWIDGREEKERQVLEKLFDTYVPPIIEWMKLSVKHVIPRLNFNMIQTLCRMLEGLLTEAIVEEGVQEVYDALFAFACVWSFGGALECDSQMDYRVLFSNWFKKEFPAVHFPDQTSVFDSFVDLEKETPEFVLWSTSVPKYTYTHDIPFSSIYVPTTDTVRLSQLTNLFADQGYPVLLIGTAGTGKTSVVREKLTTLSDEYIYGVVNFNSNSDSHVVQSIMEQYLEKKAGFQYGPPGRKKLVFFIDDLNMPTPDKYGTQSAIAFIRQHIDWKFWYDRHKIQRKEIRGCQYISCMNPKSGSFTVDDRLQRHFAQFSCVFPSEDNLSRIYKQVLTGHVSAFEDAFTSLAGKIVDASIDLHKKIAKNFLPTAVKFHYQFNLRELSSVLQGLLNMTPEFHSNERTLIRMWMHECYRVYCDRLTEVSDISRFSELITDVTKKYFEDQDQDELHVAPLLFTSFVMKTPDEESVYAPIDQYEKLRDVLYRRLEEYNEAHAVMNLELFEDAMDHICRISRIVSKPRGNAMLVGVGGSGKQSLTRLASFLNGHEVFQITVTTSYNLSNFRDDIMELYKKAGLKGISLVFLLTDNQFVDTGMLVYVNDMLSSGVIPDLFTAEEKEAVIGSIASEVKQAGRDASDPNECFDYFIEKVRSNLHVVLCFSPIGDEFRQRCRQFPALTNCTSIDWFQPWPREALVSVASRFLKDVELGGDDVRENIAHHMSFVHDCVSRVSEEFRLMERRHNYVTPKSFLELISVYRRLLAQKREELGEKVDRLETGLTKLKESADQVADLREKLEAEQVIVEEKRRDTESILSEVGRERNIVEEQAAIAKEEEEKTNKLVDEVQVHKDSCAEDLAKAEPLVEEAIKALDVVDRNSLTEMRSFSKPPDEIVEVTSAVALLLAEAGRPLPKDLSWAAAKKMMAQLDQLMRQLKEFDRDHIPQQNVDAAEKFVNAPSFDYDNISRKSVAAAGLSMWAKNMVKYHYINLDVEPKRQKLRAAEEQLESSQASLKKKQDEVARLQSKLDKLLQKYEQAREEKVRIEKQAEKTQSKLNLAQRLVDGLADENERWAASIKELRASEVALIGNVLLAASFLSYIGPFSLSFREKMLKELWIPDMHAREIPFEADIDPLYGILTTEATVAKWVNGGLPSDRISVENGAIVTNAQRWPLFIDPQLQGSTWIKKMEEPNGLHVVQTTQDRYVKVIEDAITQGEPVLIENIGETIDAVLEPILSRSFMKRGRTTYIRLGDAEVEYDPRFRLYLQTKLPNPHFRPEIAAQTTLINFLVTEQGLEDQLLGVVVNMEKPDLEENRANLLRQMNQHKIDLQECEDSLLLELSNAKGDILENPQLVENLEKTKSTSMRILESVGEAERTSKEISHSREIYRPTAVRGSLLYFQIDQLSLIDHMYQYSLDSFMSVFVKAVERAEKDEDVEKRVQNVITTVTDALFGYVARGLFERHKLIFSAMLCFRILSKAGELHPEQLAFLLRGPRNPDAGEVPEPLHDFCSQASWEMISALSSVEGANPPYSELPDDLESSNRRWKEWSEQEAPEAEKLPLEYKNLSAFQKLLVLRCLRPDRMTIALRDFVGSSLGKRFADVRSTDFATSFKDSSATVPIFFILSPGVDPVKTVEQLGQSMGYTTANGKFVNISLGQGQEDVAMRELERAYREGTWIMLNNIHLMSRWLVDLDKKLEKLLNDYQGTDGKGHPDFRCFFSAQPSERIPMGILQRSIKLTSEPPSGIKANMQRAFMTFNSNVWENSSKQSEFKSILFSLCFFHAIVVERKKFGPQGWNRNYPFNLGDLTTCISVLNNYLEEHTKIPWEDLRFVFGEIMYGGHITDDWDRRLCRTYLSTQMQENLLEGAELFPGFPVPPSSLRYEEYLEYVETSLPSEGPVAFGLHPNAEIGFLTQQGETLLRTIFELQPRTAVAGGGESIEERAKAILDDILERVPEEDFNLLELSERLEDDRSPFQIVFYQECERMNILCGVIRQSLQELDLGLKGDLSISENMEHLMHSLFLDRVPESWEHAAYPSLRTLGAWVVDLLERYSQLADWAADLQLPRVVWISGFFNPQSYLTAIMQQTARKNTWPLDRMTLVTDLTRKQPDEIDALPREGVYIRGVSLEGARWDTQSGWMDEAKLKELTPALPVMHIKAQLIDKADFRGYYECPLYRTQERGPTFISTFHLKTRMPSEHWIIRGVALLLEAV